MRRSVMLLVAVVVTAIMPAIAAQAAVPLGLPRTIAFSRTNGTGTHIFSIEPDGTELTQLASGPGVDSKPAWNVDASAITFTRRSASTTDVWIMNPDGSDPHVFLPNASSLVWSPSGEGVAFVRIRNGNHDIWTAGADGTHRIRLTTDGARDVQPVWPLEGRLWFVSDRSGRDRIYSMKSDGTGLVRLTSGPREQRQPSGNGVELVYEQDDGNDGDIVRLWTPTRSVTVKRGGPADDRDPDLAFDGELVFRRRLADGSSRLIHRWIGGSGPGTVLSDGSALDRSPAWAPASAWERAQDDQAKGNLLEAAATAQEIRDDTGSFDAGVMEMYSANPTLNYVTEIGDSDQPELISILPDGTSWSAAALSDSGTCYYIRLDDIVGTTSGMDFSASAATNCSGADAATGAYSYG
ncbi:MAG TPA: hypothetical protein VFI35_14175 [Actinomycetota bacterium]|nr:hypothetical protein [Actinomycetota bacterium]